MKNYPKDFQELKQKLEELEEKYLEMQNKDSNTNEVE